MILVVTESSGYSDTCCDREQWLPNIVILVVTESSGYSDTCCDREQWL